MKIIEKLLPDNCYRNGRKDKIDSLIIHYISAVNIDRNDPYNIDKIIQIFKDYKVSAHYLITRRGGIYLLTKEEDTAYHAGKSSLEGKSNVNNFSIGIELVGNNTVDFTDSQYLSLIQLTKDILARNNIPISRIAGHSDVSPGRKIDPGRHFDWKRYVDGLEMEKENDEQSENKLINKHNNDTEDNIENQELPKKETEESWLTTLINIIKSFFGGTNAS